MRAGDECAGVFSPAPPRHVDLTSMHPRTRSEIRLIATPAPPLMAGGMAVETRQRQVSEATPAATKVQHYWNVAAGADSRGRDRPGDCDSDGDLNITNPEAYRRHSCAHLVRDGSECPALLPKLPGPLTRLWFADGHRNTCSCRARTDPRAPSANSFLLLHDGAALVRIGASVRAPQAAPGLRGAGFTVDERTAWRPPRLSP